LPTYTLGAQWLATYPDSPLKAEMEYYIEPAEQTDEVKAQLAAITPSSLNPEELTLIDPASGSGHILVEAYELFKAIYLERGYRQRDVAQLILEKNLFGLDIDERAAQLTGFALMMKGRADDRRLFERGVKLNVMALQNSAGLDAEGLAKGVELGDYGLKPGDLAQLKRLFEHATTFGSLIQVPEELAERLPGLKQLSDATSQDLFVSDALKRLGPLVQQADLLAAHYDAVVANPPYLSTKGMTSQVKTFLKSNFPLGEKDTFAAFILRASDWADSGTSRVGLVTPFAWMYLSSFEELRRHLNSYSTIDSLIELETNAFQPAMVTVCSFVFTPRRVAGYTGCYIRLADFKGAQNQAPRTLQAIRSRDCGWFFESVQDEFKKIPGSPVAYWVSGRVREVFEHYPPLNSIAHPTGGMTTGDNDQFLRLWGEIDFKKMGLAMPDRDAAVRSRLKWFPYNKGGTFRKWFGNNSYVVNWYNDGERIIANGRAYPRSKDFYFQSSISWSASSSAYFGVRHSDVGFIFDAKGSSCFASAEQHAAILALLVTKQVKFFLGFLNPTIEYQTGDIGNLPVPVSALSDAKISEGAARAVVLARVDWNAFERSWDFQSLPILTAFTNPTPNLESSYTAWITQNRSTIAEMKRLEDENNRLFIDAYGLQDELTPDVPIEQITFTVNPAYRYRGKLSEEEQWTRFREDTMEELVSYAIGCMMGRYSLDAPGLIYAHSGNEGFDPSRYATFPADDDGIVPLTDTDWFDDDAAHRLIEFISVAWDKAHLEDNLSFLAENLSPKKNESPRDTIRRYLCDRFFKDHLQTYKKRPIYWLFSSGKQRAFQCLVYLHRYNEGTLSRMRSEYVIPLQGKMAARLEKLQGDIQSASSTAHRKRLEKERDKLEKQQVELLTFDEKLRHYADRRIHLDLDDGVKVNYGKFGDLLAEVKAVHGKKPEDG
jgi:type II restriction/modification system DNA methylase subunit YeeA